MCLQVQLRYTVVLSTRLLFAISLCSSLLLVHVCAEVPRGKRPSSLAVQMPGGDDALARDIAARYGYTLITKVKPLPDVYLFESPSLHRNDVVPRGRLDQNRLAPGEGGGKNIEDLERDPQVGFVMKQVPLPREPRGYAPPTDPEWSNQWTLLNRGQVGLEHVGRDMNVEPIWIQGITGLNVTVAVVDDGILYTNKDLSKNFAGSLSVDVAGRDDDVLPEYNPSRHMTDYHGTSCAGVIAMAKDNDFCGVGVAHDVTLVGIRLLSTHGQTDVMEAMALGHLPHEIDIYSNSWGPTDNGILVDGPGPLTRATLEEGARAGRNGLGSIYVWAVGNGRSRHDSCATDGYVSSIYTIAVGSVNQWGQRAFYDETCSARMAVTFSYNKQSRRSSLSKIQVITTTVGTGCRDDFMGTSVSCPLLAGTISLALQANPTLTWRDVQYLIAYTSSREGIGFDVNWQRNGGALWVSNEFGFGAVNGESLVTRARHWITVPEQISCTVHVNTSDREIEVHPGAPILLPVNVSPESECVSVNSLEHLVVTISLDLAGYNSTYSYNDYVDAQNLSENDYSEANISHLIGHGDVRRGDVAISLVSPHGTLSQLLSYRRNDFVNAEGFQSWPFMSVLHWGEPPLGEWLLNISYDPLRHRNGFVVLQNLSVTMYGTRSLPESVKSIPQSCHSDCYDTCAGRGKTLCDRCTLLRHSRTLECINTCPPGFNVHSGYCIDPSNITYMYRPPYKETAQSTTVMDRDITSSVGTVPIGNGRKALTSATMTLLCSAVVLLAL